MLFGQRIDNNECLEDRDLTNYGFAKVQAGTLDPRKLQVGDIVTVFSTSFFTQRCRNIHSAVVIQAGINQRGDPNVIIRQKPDPFECVTDLTWPEFQASYGLNKLGFGANAWRRPLGVKIRRYGGGGVVP